MQSTGVIIAILALLYSAEAGYWRRNRSYYQTRYSERRKYELKEDTLIDHLADPEAVIIDTRPITEREDYDLSNILGADTKAKIVLIPYNSIYNRESFFKAFDPASDQFDEDNTRVDTNIFDGMFPADFNFRSKDPVPQAVADMGSKLAIVCGTRSCGCRWNVMYDHGLRAHAWYDDNINDFILSQENDEN